MEQVTDSSEIIKTLTTLYQPKDVAELRILDGFISPGAAHKTRTIGGCYTDFVELANHVCYLAKFCEGKYYVTLNPVSADAVYGKLNTHEKVITAAADAHIARRRWVMVDSDPVRAEGFKKDSATDAEKRAAWERSETVRTWLDEQGWARPVIADSGNGYHLLYAVDMPNDANATRLVRTWLGCLSRKFSDEQVKLDVVVYNAARITKLYGTWTNKGLGTDERPHRKSSLLDVPETRVEILPAQFEGIIGQIGFPAFQAPPAKAAKPAKTTAKKDSDSSGVDSDASFDVEAFLQKHQIAHRAPDIMSDGRTRWTLDHCAFDSSHVGKDAAVFQNADGRLGYKCFHDSCASHGWKEFRARFDADYKADDPLAAGLNLYDKLEKHYQFRKNVVANQIEYRQMGETAWRMVEDADYNTIKIRAKREWDEGACKVSEIMEWADSHHTPRYHPIREFLTGLVWDGADHLGQLAGMVTTEDEGLFSEYLKSWFIRACDQVMTGTANEYMIVLAGEQGVGKTTFARAILPPPLRADYYHAAKLEAGKDGQAVLTSKWLIVDDELVGLRKTEVESIKAMLSSTLQTYRPPYGRTPITRPRLASFIGATNDAEFLSDPTGARRFLAITVHSFDLLALRVWDSTQAWAQAMAMRAAGNMGYLSDEIKAKQTTTNADKSEETPSDHLVASYVRPSTDKSTWRNTTDIALLISEAVQDEFKNVRTMPVGHTWTRELAKALRKAGFKQDRNGAKRWCVRVLDRHDKGLADLNKAQTLVNKPQTWGFSSGMAPVAAGAEGADLASWDEN